MSREDERVRELIAAVLCGDLAADAPEVRRAITADPRVRVELEEMLRTQRLVAATAQTERATLAGALKAGDDGPHVDTVAVLRAVAGAKSRRPRYRRLWLVAAAALLVVALIWGLQREQRAPLPDVPLGDPLAIVGWNSVNGGMRLTWRARLAPGQRFVLRVLDEQGRMLGMPLATTDEEWTFTRDILREWPDRVRVIVEQVDAADAGRVVRRDDELLSVPR